MNLAQAHRLYQLLIRAQVPPYWPDEGPGEVTASVKYHSVEGRDDIAVRLLATDSSLARFPELYIDEAGELYVWDADSAVEVPCALRWVRDKPYKFFQTLHAAPVKQEVAA